MTPLERMIDAYVQEANQWGVFVKDGKGVIARWHRTDDVGGMETKVIETHDDPTHASARFGLMKKNAAMRAALLALAEAPLPDLPNRLYTEDALRDWLHIIAEDRS
jgi:hypothetical protein